MIQIALNLGIVPIDWPRNNGAKSIVRKPNAGESH